MPKIKTNKSLRKRLIKKGKKIYRRSANQAHFRSVKEGQAKRGYRGKKLVSRSIMRNVKRSKI